MPEQQQKTEEIPEYHTIQVFREADMILRQPAPKCACCSIPAMNIHETCSVCAPAPPTSAPSPPSTRETSLDLIPYDHSENGIGEDWAMDVEMDATADAPAERRGSESTLYSFYFETPIMTPQQQDQDDDFTITSQETESFHNTEDLSLLQDSSSFWATGLAASTTDAVPRCNSPAHVSLTGDIQQQPKQQQPQAASRMC